MPTFYFVNVWYTLTQWRPKLKRILWIHLFRYFCLYTSESQVLENLFWTDLLQVKVRDCLRLTQLFCRNWNSIAGSLPLSDVKQFIQGLAARRQSAAFQTIMLHSDVRGTISAWSWSWSWSCRGLDSTSDHQSRTSSCQRRPPSASGERQGRTKAVRLFVRLCCLNPRVFCLLNDAITYVAIRD